MRYGYNGGYPPYVSVAEKKAKAEQKLKALQKKNPGIRPVRLVGQTLAHTWWGKAWNRNLERYADYHNRLERGRSYVRHGAVLDLQIVPGEVRALVQGSTAKPYQVQVSIKPIAKTRWLEIKKDCQGQLDSLPELLAGKIPTALQEVFMREGAGLFPTPQEIIFKCSCPDWASMCKHVAAVLYGIGARLDEEPALLFTLRQVEVNELISAAVKETRARILNKAVPASAKVIKDADLAGIFGISMEEPDFAWAAAPGQAKAPTRGEKVVPPQKNEQPAKAGVQLVKQKKERAPVTKAARQGPSREIPAALREAIKQKKVRLRLVMSPPPQVCRPTPPTTPPPVEMASLILRLIIKHKRGISADNLSVASGCPKPKLYAIVQRLKAQGKVKTLGHGIYGPG